MIPHPPALNGYEVIHNKTLRFICKTSFTGNITFQNLLDTILMTTTTLTAFDLFFMVKLRRVKVWANPTQGTAATCSVIFDGVTAGSQGDRKVHTDTSMGIEPAFVNCSPLPKTLAANYQLSSNAVAFVLACPLGSVVDVDLSFKSDTLSVAVAAQNAVVSGTVGTLAFRALDGLADAASSFIIPPPMTQV
jgi:hypothetical protein